MAEKSLVPSGKSLIDQTPRDELLTEVENLRSQNLTAAQQQDIYYQTYCFSKAFAWAAMVKFGLSKKQCLALESEKLEALAVELREKSRREIAVWVLATFAILSAPLFWAPLIVTWFAFGFLLNPLILLGLRDQNLFLISRRLKKNLGEEWFLHPRVQKALTKELQ